LRYRDCPPVLIGTAALLVPLALLISLSCRAQDVNVDKFIVRRVELQEADFRDAIQMLRLQTGANIVLGVGERPYRRITMRLENRPFLLILKKMCRAAGASLRREGSTYMIGPKGDLPDALVNVQRIVALGDSITQAGGEPGGYVALIQARLTKLYPGQKIEVLNAGISGHRSTDMQARFQRDVLDKKPDMVTISVGVNDVWHGFMDGHSRGDGPRGVALPLFEKKVGEMIEAAKAAEVQVVVFSTTVIQENLQSRENAKLADYNRALRALAKRYGALFIDLNTAFHEAIAAYRRKTGRTDNLLTTDGVHMNPAGNRLMAYTILRGLGVPEKEIADLRVESE